MNTVQLGDDGGIIKERRSGIIPQWKKGISESCGAGGSISGARDIVLSGHGNLGKDENRPYCR